MKMANSKLTNTSLISAKTTEFSECKTSIIKRQTSAIALAIAMASSAMASDRSEFPEDDRGGRFSSSPIIGFLDGESENKSFDSITRKIILDTTGQRDGVFYKDEMGKLLKEIHAHDLERFVNLITPLIDDITLGCARCSIVYDLKQIPADEHENFTKLIYPFFIFKDTDMWDRAKLITIFASIAKDERTDVIEKSLPLIKDITERHERRDIIKAVASIAKDERAGVIEKSLPLIKVITKGWIRGPIISTVASIAKDERADVIEKSLPLMNNIAHALVCDIIKTIAIVPPSLRDQFVSVLTTIKETDTGTFKRLGKQRNKYIAHVFHNHPDIKEAAYSEWMKLLSTSDDAKQAEHFIGIIVANSELLGLYEEHPLVQEAMRVGTLLETQDDPLNPYAFYKKLKKLREEPVNLDPTALPQETFNGVKVRLNPGYLKELPKVTVTFKDLPKYSKNFISQMKKQIDSRLSDQLNVKDYDALIAGSLGSYYLNTLLNIQGNPEDVVPFLASKLIAVVAHLESLDDTGSVDAFSEREHQFLMMLSSIQNCTTGKDGGIEDSYMRLPTTAKYKATSTSKTHAFLEDIIRTEVENMFSGTNHFFKDLTGGVPNEEVDQAIHQARYVGNLIKPEVGLNHPLAFDNHTQTLNSRLVEQPKENVVKAFYKYFPPHVLVDATKAAVDKQLNVPKSTLYANLSELMDKEKLVNAWGFGENFSLHLTEYGAIHLLLRLGALEEMK